MSHNDHWKSGAARETDELASGFEETLPPNDARVRMGVPSSGCAVRDNRRGAVGNLFGALGAPPASSLHTSPFGETPVSGIVRRRHGAPVEVPVARITRDEIEVAALPVRAELPRDTQQDGYMPFGELPMDVTPDFASEYVPPQPVPQAAQHKTFELSAVQLHPAVHPRTAPTVLNVRTQRRRDEKQRKDAHDIAMLSAQSHRRQRGPWIAVAFLLVVGLGFAVGATLVDSSEAGAQPDHGLASDVKASIVSEPGSAKAKLSRKLAAPSTLDGRAKAALRSTLPGAQRPSAALNPSPPQDAATAALREPSPASVAAPGKVKQNDSKLVEQEATPASTPQPAPALAEPVKSQPAKRGREVWLR